MEIYGDTRNRNGKRKLSARVRGAVCRDIASGAIHQVSSRVQCNMDDFGAGVERCKYESLRSPARFDWSQVERLRLKELIHAAICPERRNQFERNKQQQMEKKNPTDQAKGREPFGY